MERSGEEVDLADWYGNSWARSQKVCFVAEWLVFLWEALLTCRTAFSLGGVDVVVHSEVVTAVSSGGQVASAAAR